MKRLVIILISFLSFNLMAAENYEVVIDSANQKYANGQYEKAIQSYQDVLKSGYVAPALYFNLGNAYYKTNDLPHAILYYERAHRLAPNDDEINFNLNLARSQILDKIDTVPQFFLTRWWHALRGTMKADSWGYLSLATFAIFLLLFGIYLFSRLLTLKKITFWLGSIFFVIAVLSFLMGHKQSELLNTKDQAIIMNPTVTVKSSPDMSGTELFMLHEGTKVSVEDSLGEWREIRISNGNKGWIRESDYALI
ncbi:MAG TPA: tetratricopeptide repeat protein [Bacteroidales bacterium]|nr:tetratricopeptide repeat protein [Bacteroidales bacterium]